MRGQVCSFRLKLTGTQFMTHSQNFSQRSTLSDFFGVNASCQHLLKLLQIFLSLLNFLFFFINRWWCGCFSITGGVAGFFCCQRFHTQGAGFWCLWAPGGPFPPELQCLMMRRNVDATIGAQWLCDWRSKRTSVSLEERRNRTSPQYH